MVVSDEIKALKKLSRYRKQQSITYKIDFDSLWHLEPYTRLNALKQLLGMFDEDYIIASYYRDDPKNQDYYHFKKKQCSQIKMPFETMPGIEEMERLLFSCCLRYNADVIRIMERYRELANQTEKKWRTRSKKKRRPNKSQKRGKYVRM